MKIERHNYSRGAWRLLDDDGKEVYWSKPFKHSDLGWTHVSMPVCGDTKAECIAEALALLDVSLKRLRFRYSDSPQRLAVPLKDAQQALIAGEYYEVAAALPGASAAAV